MDLSEYVKEFRNDDGISIKDDTLGIDWKIPIENVLRSEKDTMHELLKEYFRLMVNGSWLRVQDFWFMIHG